MTSACEARQRALNYIEDEILSASNRGITGIEIEYLRRTEVIQLQDLGYNVTKHEEYNPNLDCEEYYEITW